MDNNPTDSNIKDQNPAPESQPVKFVRKARVRPTVEGINSSRSIIIKEPVVKISLTPQEQELISEKDSIKTPPYSTEKNNQRILPQSLIDRMEKKPTHYKAIFSIFIILLVLVAGAYEFYIRYVDQHIPPVNLQLISSPYVGALSSSTTPDSASGTADSSLTASTAPANASTTVVNASSTEATTTTVSAPTPTPLPLLTINNTPTGYLNVRSQPSTSASVITQVHPGESYGYSQTQNGWYLITLTSGQTGWVSGEYVTPE